MPTSRVRLHLPLALGVLAAPAQQALAQGCAMCGGSFGPDEPVHRAFAWSVLFMIGAVYTVVGSVAAALYFMHRRAPGSRRPAMIDFGRAPEPGPVEAPGGDIS